MAVQKVTRRVVFQSKCSSVDSAHHNVDRHGGAERIGGEG